MEKPFVLVTDRYQGLSKKGVNLLAGTISTQLGYTVLPILTCEQVTEALLAEMLWDPERDAGGLIEAAMAYPKI